MSDTLNILRNKANLLYRTLKSHGVHVEKKEKWDLFSYVVNEINWDHLRYNYKCKPRPYTSYQPSLRPLRLATHISAELAATILADIIWPSTYVPVFNTLPIAVDGDTYIPYIFIHSGIFSNNRRREKGCLQKRIWLEDAQWNFNRDHILYSGDTLNRYDQEVFFSIITNHPIEIPVGREFFFSKTHLDFYRETNSSISTVIQSLERMKNCRISIPLLNFFGPLISTYRKNSVKNENFSFMISLNPQLTRLYRDGMYSNFMDDGKLFHYAPDYTGFADFDYGGMCRKMKILKEKNPSSYFAQLGEIWPTHNEDIASIWAIIAKKGVKGSVSFKLLEDCFFKGDAVTVKFPDWMTEAYTHFIDLYGIDAGSIIFEKAMERFTSPLFVKE